MNKIGMYADDEILDFMTDGEGRGFMGRSMYDAIRETLEEKDKEIERLNNIINELEKYTIEQINIVKDNMQIIGNEGKRMATRFVVYNEYLDKLKSLKEGK